MTPGSDTRMDRVAETAGTASQVVVVAAGMDARAHRLALTPDLAWNELDRPTRPNPRYGPWSQRNAFEALSSLSPTTTPASFKA
jgi:hypothetical protein